MNTKNSSVQEYIARINKVMDYMERNLDKPVNLELLADVAGFSPFHFHRIFGALTGETLNNFVKRLRIERAASRLLNNPNEPINQIGSICGFNSPSVFCRTFKEIYGVSPLQFRESWNDIFSKNGQSDSKIDKLHPTQAEYLRRVEITKQWRIQMNSNIEIKQLPDLNLLYCRHTGAFNEIGQAYEKLFKWAGARGLLNFPVTKGVTVYHDDPKVTQPDKVRQSACITIENEVKPEGEIGKMTIPGGTFVVGHFEIGVTEFEQAWNAVCLWLAESGYQPADGYPYELYHNNHENHPEKKFIVDICIPVKPL